MSHEQSETIERPSGAYNVYGGTQYPLSPIFGFEQARYENVPQAVNAAQWRSQMGGGPEGGQSPAYGFQPQPQPEYIGLIHKLVQALGDERLGALFAPGMGLLKAPQAIGNALRMRPNMSSERGSIPAFHNPNVRDPTPQDPGGFNVPTRIMEQQAPIRSTAESQSVPDMRQNYLSGIEGMQEIDKARRGVMGPVKQMEANTFLKQVPQMQAVVDEAAKQMHGMRSDVLNRTYPFGYEHTDYPTNIGNLRRPLYPEMN